MHFMLLRLCRQKQKFPPIFCKLLALALLALALALAPASLVWKTIVDIFGVDFTVLRQKCNSAF